MLVCARTHPRRRLRWEQRGLATDMTCPAFSAALGYHCLHNYFLYFRFVASIFMPFCHTAFPRLVYCGHGRFDVSQSMLQRYVTGEVEIPIGFAPKP